MKRIEVHKQVRLPLSKCVELVLSGVKFRLFRAAITVTIISLAAAFLMTMLTESLVERQVRQAISTALGPRKDFLFWVSRISVPLDEPKVMAELAAVTPGGPRWLELKSWGNLTDQELADQSELARQADIYLRFFNNLDEGQRRVMVSRARGADIFAHLHSPERFSAFEANLTKIGRKFPTEPAEFRSFIDKWERSDPIRRRIMTGHAAAIEQVERHLAGTPAKLALVEPSEALLAQLEAAGFQLEAEQLEQVKKTARLNAEAERLAKMLSVPAIRTRLARRNNAEIADANAPMLFKTISSSGGAKWLIDTVADQMNKLAQFREQLAQNQQLSDEGRKLLVAASLIEGFDFDRDQIIRVAQSHQDAARLRDIETSLAAAGAQEAGMFGFPARTQWLILVSFLVCVVGIANAMLMSVTERFREIATMKCLGATDGFIMINFILESILQGVAGGIIGTILGFLLGSLRSWASYGLESFAQLPAVTLAQAAAISFVISMIVSALAAVYPARVAAKLAPMEAMRIE